MGETGERAPDEMPKWLEPETKSVPPREKVEAPRPPERRAPAPSAAPSVSRGQGRSESAPGGRTSATPAALGAQLTVLQGVGPRHAQTLGALGMVTLGDMLYYFPRRYEDYSQLKPIKNLWVNEIVTVIGAVQSVGTRPVKGGKLQLTEAVITDGTGALRLTWFNQPWIANRMKTGDNIAAS